MSRYRSEAITYFDNVPRYGHTEDLYEFVEGDKKDYINGVILIPGVVVGITTVIFTILAIFTCTCSKSFLSGRAFSVGEGAIIRAAFLFSAGIVLASSILFLTLGGDSFSNAFDDFEGSKEDLFKFTNEGADILANIRAELGNLTETNRILQENIAMGVCEDLPLEAIQLLDDISETIVSSNYTDELNQLRHFEDGLEKSFGIEKQSLVNELLGEVEKSIGFLKYGGLPSILISSILGCGAILSWCGLKSSVLRSFQTYFILPLLVCVAIISCAIISVLGVVLLIFSDLCTGGEDQSPEGSIKIVLDGIQTDEIVRQMFDYYIIDGCRIASPFGGLIETKDALEVISTDINEVIDSARDYFTSVCNNSTVLSALLTESNSDLIDLNTALRKALSVTGCENINSMYVAAMHTGTCRSTPNAMWWMFGTFFAVWAGGLCMLVFRAACYPNRLDGKAEIGGTDVDSVGCHSIDDGLGGDSIDGDSFDM